MIHLDTNFLIIALKAGSAQEATLDGWLSSKEPLGISAVAWTEFFAGPLSVRDEATARQMFRQVEPFLSQDAEQAAQLFNKTGRRSRSMPDCMIAAVAMRCGARLATDNASDFQAFVQHGLALA